MSGAEQDTGLEDAEWVGRCYTKARRSPLSYGTVHGGAGRSLRLPFGPYTVTQLGVFVGSVVLLVLTRPVWGGHGLLDVVVLLGAPLGAGFALRHLHIDGRNPVAALVSVAVMLSGPRWGRLGGRPHRPPRPAVAARPGTRRAAPPRPRHEGDARLAGHAASIPAAAPPAPAPVLSGMQALLAQHPLPTALEKP